ncbi:hypothetical protein [Deinococcus alpinitundrae]|uniref:hypothetical protein n=1 Tax=Deinococcus alpinitundrae TaxID=468913 RepID=UPI00137B80D4|nr:hypothetical protein [Deinococcus alpinitundrae]
MQRFWRSVFWVLVFGLGLGAVQAGGAGARPPVPGPRSVPVMVMNFSAGDPDGVFVCQDGSTVATEQVGSALRLTRRGEVSSNGQVLWKAGAHQSYRLTLGQAVLLICRRATSQDAALVPGSVQNYHCSNAVSLAVVPFPEAVAVTSFQPGQRPDIAGWLPRTRSVSGDQYQNSEWTWSTGGQLGTLIFHGKTVAQGCRLQ